jgi:hypothetical protein
MKDVVQLLFKAMRGGTAKVRTETPEQRLDRERRANERAGQVFGLTPAQQRVLARAKSSR